MMKTFRALIKFINVFVENYLIYFVLLAFLVAYIGHSLLLHYNFNSHSWDLGIFAQQTWLYSHLAGAYNTVRGTNLLSDHFGVILYLFAPIYRIFPRAETILVIQALLVVLSGLPIFYLSKKLLKSGLAGCAIVFAFLSSSGIRQAIDFDFHLATVAVFFFAFFLHFWMNKKYLWSVILAVLAVLCKEDVPLYIAFTALALMILERKERGNLKKTVLLLFGSIVAFFAIMKIMLLFPSTAANANYFSFNYLGTGYGDALKNFFAHPIYVLQIIWQQFIQNELKVSTFKTYFYGFWYLPFLSPDIMVASIPFLITKFISDRSAQWGLNGQYAVTGMYILSIATVYSLYRVTRLTKKWQKQIIALWAIIFLLFTFNYNFLNVGRGYWDVFDVAKWQSTKQYTELNNLIKMVPPDASVGAQEKILPHLASREEAYLYRCQTCFLPDEDQIEYILLDDRFEFAFSQNSPSDVKSIVLEKTMDKTDNKGKYEVVAKDEQVDHSSYLLKRINE